MWKKTDLPQSSSDYIASKSAPRVAEERAIIGVTILLKGDLSGEEHLLVQGRVEGKIRLDGNNLTVGSQGRVKADIHAQVISVEGEVRGNLFGEEKIIIRKTGNVKGNLVAPRVSLEEGATFKGSIDMGSQNKKSSSSQPAQETKPRSLSSPKKASTKGGRSTPKTAEMPLGRRQ